MRVRFGSFVLDFEARQLERGGHPVHLTPKALELIELLVERRPNAVSKAEIHDRLWPDTFVADVNLPYSSTSCARRSRTTPTSPPSCGR